MEPILIKAGQHFHVKQIYFHPTTSEKFWYGFDGHLFEQAANMDPGIFIVKDSSGIYYSGHTTLEKGVMPGLLYKFA